MHLEQLLKLPSPPPLKLPSWVTRARARAAEVPGGRGRQVLTRHATVNCHLDNERRVPVALAEKQPSLRFGRISAQQRRLKMARGRGRANASRQPPRPRPLLLWQPAGRQPPMPMGLKGSNTANVPTRAKQQHLSGHKHARRKSESVPAGGTSRKPSCCCKPVGYRTLLQQHSRTLPRPGSLLTPGSKKPMGMTLRGAALMPWKRCSILRCRCAHCRRHRGSPPCGRSPLEATPQPSPLKSHALGSLLSTGQCLLPSEIKAHALGSRLSKQRCPFAPVMSHSRIALRGSVTQKLHCACHQKHQWHGLMFSTGALLKGKGPQEAVQSCLALKQCLAGSGQLDFPLKPSRSLIWPGQHGS